MIILGKSEYHSNDKIRYDGQSVNINQRYDENETDSASDVDYSSRDRSGYQNIGAKHVGT
jgi:hypothetical protein